MKKYKAIFLDWDDTIGDFHHAELHALRDIYEKYNLTKLYPTFEDYYNEYHPYNLMLWDKYGQSLITKDELHLERFYHPISKQLFADSDFTDYDAKCMGKDFSALTLEYFSCLPDAEQVVRYLFSKYSLTIVSNGFIEQQYEKIRRSGLADCFNHVVLSEEVGVQKPNADIFFYALGLDNLRSDEVLMIGDGWSSDIQGAKNAGIDQMWIHESEEKEKQATYRVSCLREIMSVL